MAANSKTFGQQVTRNQSSRRDANYQHIADYTAADVGSSYAKDQRSRVTDDDAQNALSESSVTGLRRALVDPHVSIISPRIPLTSSSTVQKQHIDPLNRVLDAHYSTSSDLLPNFASPKTPIQLPIGSRGRPIDLDATSFGSSSDDEDKNKRNISIKCDSRSASPTFSFRASPVTVVDTSKHSRGRTHSRDRSSDSYFPSNNKSITADDLFENEFVFINVRCENTPFVIRCPTEGCLRYKFADNPFESSIATNHFDNHHPEMFKGRLATESEIFDWFGIEVKDVNESWVQKRAGRRRYKCNIGLDKRPRYDSDSKPAVGSPILGSIEDEYDDTNTGLYYGTMPDVAPRYSHRTIETAGNVSDSDDDTLGIELEDDCSDNGLDDEYVPKSYGKEVPARRSKSPIRTRASLKTDQKKSLIVKLKYKGHATNAVEMRTNTDCNDNCLDSGNLRHDITSSQIPSVDPTRRDEEYSSKPSSRRLGL